MQLQQKDSVFTPYDIGSKPKKEIDPKNLVPASKIFNAYKQTKKYVRRTPTTLAPQISERFGAKIYFKREDGQFTGSYKVRGVFNRLLNLSEDQKKQGVICATSGNQGASLGYACQELKIKAVIVMPDTVPQDKARHVKKYQGPNTQVISHGLKLSEAMKYAENYAIQHDLTLISFEDDHVVEGCGTVAVDILEDIPEQKIDYILYSMASGSLAAGVGSYLKHMSPETIQVGVEPEKEGIQNYETLSTEVIQQKQINHTLMEESTLISHRRSYYAQILDQTLDGIYHVSDGQACSFVTYLFNKEKIVVEPYSAVCPSALENIKDLIKGKTVVCILCGSFRYDVGRLSEIRTLSNVYEGKLFYLMVSFFAKHGAIKQFLTQCLSEDDQICQIEYTRKNNREKGPALVGIESKNQETFQQVLNKLKERNIDYKVLNPKDPLFKLKV